MAKKRRINYRAEQNRKRNLEQAEIRRKQARNKAIWDAHGKQIIIGSVALIVAIILIWLGCKWFVGPGGSLPNFFGNLRTVESDWIVTNLGTTSKPKYFKLGEVTSPEGYTQDTEFSTGTDSKAQNFYFRADDENAAVQTIYTSGVANKTAAEMLETVLGYGYYVSAGENTTANIGGYDAHYAYFVYGDSTTATDTDLDGESDYVDGYPSLCMYIDSVEDSCVLIMFNGANVALDDVADEATMLAEAEKLLPMLTVEK